MNLRPGRFIRRACAAAVVGGLTFGCGGDEAPYDPESPWTEGTLGVWQAGLNVGQAGGCSTAIVRGLAQQLIDEINCLRPGTLAQFSRGDIREGESVWPYLQAPAVAGLHAALDQRGRAMTMNSALRTLPQQYLLYKWYQDGQCGIGLAASPGRSPHESGKAIDIEDHGGWEPSLENHGWRWHGNDDAVHFDYVGDGTVDLSGLSVRAFQRLWNRNHPGDLIAEDGDYGPQTEGKLRASPVDGFDIGGCEPEPPPPPPPPPPPDAAPPVVTPDAALPPDAAPPVVTPDAAVKDAIVDLPADAWEAPPDASGGSGAGGSGGATGAGGAGAGGDSPGPDDFEPAFDAGVGSPDASSGLGGGAPSGLQGQQQSSLRSVHYDGGCQGVPGRAPAGWALLLAAAAPWRRRRG